jgi:fatty acid-binding protein DegV
LIPDDAEELKQQIADEFNCADLWVTDFSPLLGFTVGPGALAVGYYND